MPRHFVTLTPQIVAIGQDENLFTPVGFDDLARDGNSELLDVLLFDLCLDDAGTGRLRRRLASLPNRRGRLGESVLLRRVSFPHLCVAPTASRHAAAARVGIERREVGELQRDAVRVAETVRVRTLGVDAQRVEIAR